MAEGRDLTSSRGFRFVRAFARLLLRTRFRKIEVVGGEHVPAEGAALVVANHFSSLVDSLILLHASPRPASFLAKAPLWKNALLRPFLDWAGALPVYRPEDRDENLGHGARENVEVFRRCQERLAAGGSLAVFPEGTTQPQPRLLPLRTGAARMALDAGVPVHVVPVGLTYEPAHVERRGTALVRFGPPMRVDGPSAWGSRRAAISGLTRDVESALHALLAEADSQGELLLLQTLRVAWDQERGLSPPETLAEEDERNRRFSHGLERLRRRAPDAVEDLRATCDAWRRSLDLAGIDPEMLEQRYSPGRVLRFVFREGPLLLLGAPLALLAAVVTWPARRLGDVLALRVTGGDESLWSICRILGASFLLVVLSLLLAIVLLVVRGPGWALAGLLGPSLLYAFHVAWTDHRISVRDRTRAFLLLAGGQLRGNLRRQRRQLCEQLDRALERLGAQDGEPEAATAGEARA